MVVADNLFHIKTLACTSNPQQIIYAALHQCYSHNFVGNEKLPSEEKCGEIAINRLLAGDRGHYSPLETVSITLACAGIPHNLVQQITRHRHLSFAIQSFRYTGEQVVEVAQGLRDVEEVFYLRPVGTYNDREGRKYNYLYDMRASDLNSCLEASRRYALSMKKGVAPEQARGMLPFDYRQHMVMAGNLRAMLHVLDLRMKTNAQVEIQWFSELLLLRLLEWVPEIAAWYKERRAYKAKLAP